MKLKRIHATLLFIGIFAITYLAFTLCGFTPFIDLLSPGYQAHSKNSSNFDHRYGLRQHTFAVHSLMTSVNIQVIFRIDEGSAVYSLIDPTGEVHWQGEIISGEKFNESRGFGAISGEWIFQIELLDATGSYNVYWYGE
jgi:hypothetical protein